MNLQKSKSISNHCYKKPQPKNHEPRRKSLRAEAGELQKPEATESLLRATSQEAKSNTSHEGPAFSFLPRTETVKQCSYNAFGI
jgi:hypothetical protein